MRTVPVGYLAAAVSAAEARGVDARSLLRAAGIAPHLLDDPRARFTSDQVAAFTRDLWRRADDELFGLGVAPVPRGTFRLVGHALIHCPDLATVVHRFVGFGTALPGLPRFALAAGDAGAVRLSMDLRGGADPGHLVTDFLLVFTHRFAGWLVGRRLAPVAVELPYPAPGDVVEYDRMFGVAPNFGAPRAALVFDERVLRLPIVRDEDALESYLREAPADVLARRDYGTTLADQVRTILERGTSRLGSDDIAERLALSESHLRRRLSEQGTSLTRIREELQRDAAITALARGEAVDVISARIGFSEPRAFRRAFRRWTGRSPSAYQAGAPDSD